MHGSHVSVYIDDILVFTDDLESHLAALDELFRRFVKAGITLNFSKCQFLKNEIDYLGF